MTNATVDTTGGSIPPGAQTEQVWDGRNWTDDRLQQWHVTLERELPHIASLMRPSVGQVVADSEVLVVANAGDGFGEVSHLIREDQILIDLVGTHSPNGEMRGTYEGICW